MFPTATHDARPDPDPIGGETSFSALRARFGGGGRAGAGVVGFCAAVDWRLPEGGLGRGALHEVLAADPGAAAAFCAVLLGRAAGTVLWIDAAPDAWPPGLAAFGLDPADLVLVHAPRGADALWAFEEALRSPAVAGALLVVRGRPPDMTASRRLQLAAEGGGGIGLILLPGTGTVQRSVARTRWRIGAAADGNGERPRWDVSLLRCVGGRAGSWTLAWNAEAGVLELAEPTGAGAGRS